MEPRDDRSDVVVHSGRVAASLVIASAVLAGCGTITGIASPAPVSSNSASATVATTSSAAVLSSPFTSRSSGAAVASSTATEEVFQCPTDWEMDELTQLITVVSASRVDGGSRACLYDIVQGSGYTRATISVVSPYVDEGTAVSVDQARAHLTDIRNSWVEAAETDDGVVIPFDIVDQPDLGDGAFSAPSHDPDGRGCEVYVPIAGNRTSFVFFDNGEDQQELQIPDAELACQAALAVAATLKD